MTGKKWDKKIGKAVLPTIQEKMKVSYYIILAVVSSVLVITYFISKHTIERNAVESRMSALKVFAEKVDAQMENIINTSDFIYNSSSVNHYIKEMENSADSYQWHYNYTKLYRVMQDFTDTIRNSGRDYQILLYQAKQGVLYYSWDYNKPDAVEIGKDIPEIQVTGAKRNAVFRQSYRAADKNKMFYFYNQYKGIGSEDENLCVIIGIREDDFMEMTDILTEGGNEVGFYVQEAGAIYPSGNRYLNLKGTEEKNFYGKQEGTFKTSVENVKRIYLFVKLEVMDWYLLQSIGQSSVIHELNEWWRISVLCLMSVLAAVFGVLLYLNRSIIYPINRLYKEMQRVKDGIKDLKKPERIGKDEIGNLTEQFYGMVQRIEELEREAILKEKQKYQLEMEALQAQINPHFLYNTINAVKMLLRMKQEEEAGAALTALTEILKNTVSKSCKLTTLKEEMNVLESYVFIQKLRYNTFRYEMQLPKKLEECRILKFLIQPFIENCFLHGFEEVNEDTEIKVTVQEKQGNLEIWVIDNGTGMTEETIEEILAGKKKGRGLNGIGIQNVTERVKKNYGSEYYVKIQSQLKKGTSVCIVLPVIREEKDENFNS